MSEIIHKTEPVEHWIVDGKAYRMATQADVGKEVSSTDYAIGKGGALNAIGKLNGVDRTTELPFSSRGTYWRYAYVQDYSLLQPQVEHVVDCVTVKQRIAQRIMDDKAMKQAEATVTNCVVLPTTKPIDWTKPVRTKDGRAVRVLCTDGPGEYPVVGFIGPNLVTSNWTLEGKYNRTGFPAHAKFDLENAPQRIQREYWVNVYDDPWMSKLYATKNDAVMMRNQVQKCLACVKITIDCEEGEGL